MDKGRINLRYGANNSFIKNLRENSESVFYKLNSRILRGTNTLLKKPKKLFYQDYEGAKYYRIPLLFKTQKGTILAICDRRKNIVDDWEDISLVLRRKEKAGAFGEMIRLIDLPQNYVQGKYAFTIDSAIVQSKKTARIFLFTTMFPRGRGFFESEKTTGYIEIAGRKYLELKDNCDNSYYLKHGFIYRLNGENTGFEVIVKDRQEFKNLGDIYKNGKHKGNIFLADGDYWIKQTSYIYLIYSDDDGKTWQGPRDLNPMVKKNYMKFLGVSPAKGLYLNEGRMIIPAYFTNEFDKQSSCLIGSDDEGQTWKLLAIGNDGRKIGNESLNFLTDYDGSFQLGENSIVELSDGSLKTFNRNYFHGLPYKIMFAESRDRGDSFQNEIKELEVSSQAWCQNSSITFKYEGAEYVLISHPSSGNSWERKKGVVDLFKYEGGQLVHKKRKTIYKGYFQYSSLERIDGETFAIFYEKVTSKIEGKFELVYWEFKCSYLFG